MGDSFIVLPSQDLAAIYDDEVKRLYLWAKGPWSSSIQGGFQRDPDWVGGLKFKLQGVQLEDRAGIPDSYATTMFEVSIMDPERDDGELKDVLIETANGTQQVSINKVDTVRSW